MSEPKAIRIRQVRVMDPYRGIDSHDEDVWIADGRIVPGGDGLDAQVQQVHGRGLWLVPRLIDMHVHFREPGQTWKETIETGSQAAAHGGITMVAAMPNTTPVVDSPELVEWIGQRGRAIGLTRVLPIGAVTLHSAGEELADLYRMRESGAAAFSDDGQPVTSGGMMRAALSYARTLGAPIINHAEDRTLVQGASVHEGRASHEMGIPGVPEAAEASMVWRDVLLAGLTGGWLHVAHVSAQESIQAIAYAAARRYPVSAEAAPHHLMLTDDALLNWGYNAATKVNPPLRPDASREALLNAVASGLISVLASDHAPHHADEKARPYVDAPFGISGIETILGVLMTALIDSGRMRPLEAWALMTSGPNRVLGLEYPGLVPGAAADLTLIDPDHDWTVDPGQFYSLGKNTPLAGTRLKGQPVATMVDGRWTMQEGEVRDAGISQIS